MKCIDDEIPFEIPQSWCWARMSSVLDVRDGTHDTPNYVQSGYPLITGKDFYNGYFDLSKTQYISASDFEIICQRSKVDVGDILFSMIGGNIGSQILITEENYFEMAIKNVALFKHYSKGLINESYLSYFLQSRVYDFRAIASGGAQSFVSLKQLRNYLIPIPSLSEQNHIVSKIEEIMPIADKYEKSQEALNKLNAEIFDKLKKSVMQEAIQGKLVPQDPNDEPASVLLDRIKEEKAKLFKEGKLKKKDLVDSIIFKGDDNKYYETIGSSTECIEDRILFEIPETWTWVTLGSLVQNCSGLAYKKENLDERADVYIRVLRGGNIDDGRWSMKDDDVMIAAKFVKPELLLTAGTFITPAVTSIEQMGKTALVREDQPQTVVGGFVLMLLPFFRDWSLLNYLELIFQTEYYKNYCRSVTNKSGQAFYNLSRQKLMQFLVPLPPLNERIAIAKEVAKINLLMR